MQVTLTEHPPQAVVVAIRGELDIDTVSELNDVIERALDRPVPHVVVDLTDVRFCDSTGLSAFVIGHRRAAGSGGWLRLAVPHGWMHRLITTIGLHRYLAVHPDVPTALAA